jgi:hypothetical protein
MRSALIPNRAVRPRERIELLPFRVYPLLSAGGQ